VVFIFKYLSNMCFNYRIALTYDQRVYYGFDWMCSCYRTYYLHM